MKTYIKKIIFFILISVLLLTYFFKDDYKTIDGITPEILDQPAQTEIKNAETISFSKDGYAYNLTPLYNYTINALVVHRMDYRWFSLYNSDSVFPIDLCLMWGDNIKNKVYIDKTLTFKQDFRFCLYNWFGNLPVKQDMISNNHLLAVDKNLEKTMDKIKTGDQVAISGYLVNVKASKDGKVSEFDPSSFSLNTSIARNDSGGGACEIIYVKDIKILKVGHPILSLLFKMCLLALIVWGVIGILIMIRESKKVLPPQG